jgi:predicted dehydrogenase
MSKKIKFAVIGCGHIGKRHASMIEKNLDSELVAMVDSNDFLKAAIESEFNVPFFNSLQDLISSKIEIDVINICTPNNEHAPLSILALNEGFNVVCEKPMALTLKECTEVLNVAELSSKLVFCVMQNRYSPPSVWLKDIITQGLLGKIFMVQINCYWNRDYRYYKPGNWKGSMKYDGGTLFTQFSHFIDIMYWLFGDIENIQAKFNDFTHKDLTEFEDSGIVSFDFVNGGMGSINYSTAIWDTNLESSITIIGENGSVKVGGQYMNEVEYCHIKDYTMPKLGESSPANDYGFYKGSAANHHFVIENVVDTLLGKTTATTNAFEGLKVVEIIERIYSLKG